MSDHGNYKKAKFLVYIEALCLLVGCALGIDGIVLVINNDQSSVFLIIASLCVLAIGMFVAEKVEELPR